MATSLPWAIPLRAWCAPAGFIFTCFLMAHINPVRWTLSPFYRWGKNWKMLDHSVQATWWRSDCLGSHMLDCLAPQPTLFSPAPVRWDSLMRPVWYQQSVMVAAFWGAIHLSSLFHLCHWKADLGDGRAWVHPRLTSFSLERSSRACPTDPAPAWVRIPPKGGLPPCATHCPFSFLNYFFPSCFEI